jgi:hypothetical protein
MSLGLVAQGFPLEARDPRAARGFVIALCDLADLQNDPSHRREATLGLAGKATASGSSFLATFSIHNPDEREQEALAFVVVIGKIRNSTEPVCKNTRLQ